MQSLARIASGAAIQGSMEQFAQIVPALVHVCNTAAENESAALLDGLVQVSTCCVCCLFMWREGWSVGVGCNCRQLTLLDGASKEVAVQLDES